MNLRVAAAFWTLEKLPGEEMPEIAARALADGYDSESLRALAGESPAPMRELASLFTAALAECSISIPNKQKAARAVAEYYSGSILSETLSPYEGAKKIVYEICHAMQHTPEDLQAFVALESEYDDFCDATRIDYYGRTYCDRIKQQLESRIVLEAKKIIGSAA